MRSVERLKLRSQESGFIIVDGEENILRILRLHFSSKPDIIAGVVSRKGMLIYEGVKVLSLHTQFMSDDTEVVSITFTNGDSNYTKPVGTEYLSQIDFLQISRTKW